MTQTLKKKLDDNHPTDDPVQPIKEWVSFLNNLTALSASFIYCGKPDENSVNKDIQENLKHQADHLWDLVEHCDEENLKHSLYTVNIAFDLLTKHGVELIQQLWTT